MTKKRTIITAIAMIAVILTMIATIVVMLVVFDESKKNKVITSITLESLDANISYKYTWNGNTKEVGDGESIKLSSSPKSTDLILAEEINMSSKASEFVLEYKFTNNSTKDMLVTLSDFPDIQNIEYRFCVSDTQITDFSNLEKSGVFETQLLKTSKYVYVFVNLIDETFDTLFSGTIAWNLVEAKTFTVNYSTIGAKNHNQFVSETVIGNMPFVPSDIIPTKPGYAFVGWYLDSSLTIPFEAGDVITGDTTLYAKYLLSTVDSANLILNNSNKTAVITGDIITTGETYVIPDEIVYGSSTYKVIGLDANLKSETIKQLYIGNNISSVPTDFAKSNERLNYVFIGANVANMGDYAFYGNTALKIVKFASNSMLQTVGEYSFYGDSILTNIKLTSLGEYTFAFCDNLEEIYFNKNLTSIGDRCFYASKKLDRIEIPGFIEKIGEYAFAEIINLSTVYMHEGVKTIGNFAFADTRVSSLYIPSTVSFIGVGIVSEKYVDLNIKLDSNNLIYDSRERFNGIIESKTNKIILGTAYSLIPQTVCEIGDYAYAFNKNITDITLINNIKSIGDYAYYSCANLVKFNTLDGVETIGYNAFMNCKNMTNLKIGKNVENIYSGIISGCDNLSRIVVDDRNAVFDSRDNANAIIKTSDDAIIFGCRNTSIPISVTKLENSAFENIKTLANITLHDRLSYIGEKCFKDCTGLTTIIIPSNVSIIKKEVFKGCLNLESVVFNDTSTWSCRGQVVDVSNDIINASNFKSDTYWLNNNMTKN